MPDRKTAAAAAVAVSLAVPAVALAGAKPGYYIDPATNTTVINKSAHKIKTFQIGCVNGGSVAGTVTVKGVKISKKGKFSYSGEATDEAAGGSVKIQVKISGKFGKSTLKGTFSSTGSPAPCATSTFKAKYYGKHPQG